MNRLIGESRSGSVRSPAQTPAVSGCDGSTARAQANSFFSSARASSGLFARLEPAVARAVGVVRLVEQVPGVDSPVGLEVADDAGDVALQLVMPLRVLEDHRARALHPAGVVQARLRRVLLAGVRERVPDTVEQHEHHADLVPVGRGQELLDPLEESLRVLLPEQVMQEDPDAVEAQALGPAELAVDRGQVEGVGLPHLELVDRRARARSCSRRARDVPRPGLGPRDRPGAWLRGGRGIQGWGEDSCQR